jgi:hypothetical protein
MATADDFVQLPIGEFEEALGLAVCVVFQTQRAQYRILESDSDWRSPTTRFITCFRTQIFGACKRSKASPGLLFEKLCPTFDPLASSHYRVWCQGFNLCDCMQLVECLVFHFRLLLTGRSAHALTKIIAQ